MNDALRLNFLLYDGDCLELTVVIMRGGATARQRHERAVGLRRVVEPGAVVVVGGTQTAATFQLTHRQQAETISQFHAHHVQIKTGFAI